MNKNKVIILINTIAIFLGMFLFHSIYEFFPNFITASLFPVNESLYEHLKLIYVSSILIGIIIYIILLIKKIHINNYFLGLLTSTILNIGLYFLTFIPLYNRFGESLLLAMGLFLIILIITQYIFYKIITKEEKETFNFISMIIIPFLWVILVYLTLNPLHNDFFFDTKEEKYGISEYQNL